jgi:hypothetical protein
MVVVCGMLFLFVVCCFAVVLACCLLYVVCGFCLLYVVMLIMCGCEKIYGCLKNKGGKEN